ALNAELQLDSTKTTAAEACAVLRARIETALARGVMVRTSTGPLCTTDLGVLTQCEAPCLAGSGCDVRTQCAAGDLASGCNGTCNATCSVVSPGFTCVGLCAGACTGSLPVACPGECDGTCDAPSYDGVCDVGCSSGFSGTCDGTCTGMCDGTNVAG